MSASRSYPTPGWQALLLEDEVKASIWFNASGVASVLWLGMPLGTHTAFYAMGIADMEVCLLRTLWTWVLVFGWTFVPGITAFDKAAQHSPPAELEPRRNIGQHLASRDANYCGAWATALASAQAVHEMASARFRLG